MTQRISRESGPEAELWSDSDSDEGPEKVSITDLRQVEHLYNSVAPKTAEVSEFVIQEPSVGHHIQIQSVESHLDIEDLSQIIQLVSDLGMIQADFSRAFYAGKIRKTKSTFWLVLTLNSANCTFYNSKRPVLAIEVNQVELDHRSVYFKRADQVAENQLTI